MPISSSARESSPNDVRQRPARLVYWRRTPTRPSIPGGRISLRQTLRHRLGRDSASGRRANGADRHHAERSRRLRDANVVRLHVAMGDAFLLEVFDGGQKMFAKPVHQPTLYGPSVPSQRVTVTVPPGWRHADRSFSARPRAMAAIRSLPALSMCSRKNGIPSSRLRSAQSSTIRR